MPIRQRPELQTWSSPDLACWVVGVYCKYKGWGKIVVRDLAWNRVKNFRGRILGHPVGVRLLPSRHQWSGGDRIIANLCYWTRLLVKSTKTDRSMLPTAKWPLISKKFLSCQNVSSNLRLRNKISNLVRYFLQFLEICLFTSNEPGDISLGFSDLCALMSPEAIIRLFEF
jgi:hypothetical protein